MSRGRMVNSVFPRDKCLTRRCPRIFGSSPPRAVRLSGKPGTPMHPNAILHEIRQLYNVSDRLDVLAEQHPLVSDALVSISGSVRNTATLLEVVVAMKMPLLAGLDPASA
jgi:hypothetical protein